MFTPLVGVPMENSLDLVIVWAMYGSFTCKTFWPLPDTCPSPPSGTGEGLPVSWPRSLVRGGTRAHTVAHQVGTCHFRARVSLRVAALGRNMQSTVPAW